MATATKNTSVKYVTVEKIVDDGVTLTLSKAEAQTLAEVIALFGGSPDTSPRKHTNAIDAALRKAGYSYDYARHRKLFGNTSSVYFERDTLALVEAE